MKMLKGNGPQLFHIINCAMNVVHASEQHLDWQQRKAASFTFSPLYAGSASVGYQPVSSYGGGISLGRAMAISGAAASPNMGYHTSSIVAFIMTFFNVRLGWWLPNPAEKGSDSPWRARQPWMGALATEALGYTTESGPLIYLSDGGHFDNLGLYEMVKRRCHRIVVVDAGCDAKYEYEDLENALRKIRIDLGVRIELKGLPTRNSTEPITLGVIHYADVDGTEKKPGELIYIKPVLTGKEPEDVTRFATKTANRRYPFPHQSTSDQFFDEAQFESYRVLGMHTVLHCFPKTGTWPERGDVTSRENSSPSGVILDAPAPPSGISGFVGSLCHAIWGQACKVANSDALAVTLQQCKPDPGGRAM